MKGIYLHLLCGLCLWYNAVNAQCTVNDAGVKDCECHCSACENGTCISGCAVGWSGSEEFFCQKKNIAMTKTKTYQTTTKDGMSLPSNAVDGNVCTSSSTKVNLDQYWAVMLDKEYEIVGLDILHGWDGRYDIYINKNKRNIQQEFLCASLNLTAYVKVNVKCTNAMNGNLVIITQPGNGSVHLTEVEIYACTAGTFGSECSPCRFGVDSQTGVCKRQPSSKTSWLHTSDIRKWTIVAQAIFIFSIFDFKTL